MKENEIISTRIFDYPTAKLWEAWTNPDHLKIWWGPNGFTNTFDEYDFSEGGVWRFTMHSPDGKDYFNENVFREIETEKRIVLDHVVDPLFRLEVVFEPISERTRIVFRMIFESKELCEALKPVCVPSNEENFDRLEVVLHGIDSV